MRVEIDRHLCTPPSKSPDTPVLTASIPPLEERGAEGMRNCESYRYAGTYLRRRLSQARDVNRRSRSLFRRSWPNV